MTDFINTLNGIMNGTWSFFNNFISTVISTPLLAFFCIGVPVLLLALVLAKALLGLRN